MSSNGRAARVLVVEDDPAVRRSLERVLDRHGYESELVGEGAAALRAVARGRPDAIVLDIGLPDISGLEVCRRLREQGDATPILMVTARDAVSDRVEGLDAGADDYLVKPFALVELLARLRAILRRPVLQAENEPPEVLRFVDVELDLGSVSAVRGDRPLELTRTELLLLELFLRNPRHTLTREQILDRVWGIDARTSTNGVEVYIGYLRRKLEAGGEPRLLQTVRGFGYRLDEE